MDNKLIKTGYYGIPNDGKINFSITQKRMTVSMSGLFPWNYHQDIHVLNEDGSNSGGNAIGHFYTADFDEILRSATKD